MSPYSGIHSCPVEILWLIFLSLRPDSKSILSCRAACRRFLESIDSSVDVQLALKLDSWGYQETSISRELTRAQLLSKLDAHVEAWRTLDWEKLVLEIPSGSAYDLAQGFYVCVDTDEESIVTCVKLPSRITGAVHRVYTCDVGFSIKDLAIDPSQDLIILFEMPESAQHPALHCRKLSDGTIHPAARTPTIVTDQSRGSSYPIRIQIYESVVMFTWGTWSAGQRTSVCVWNWTTGQLLWQMLGRTTNDCEGYLLNTTAMLMPYTDKYELELQIWSFTSDITGKLVQRFALPGPPDDKRLRSVFVKGDMTPPPCDLGISSVPFRPHITSRMVKVGWGPRNAMHMGEIFVPAHTFTTSFDYPPTSTIPYTSWTSRRAHSLANISQDNLFEVYNSSSRHVQMASKSEVEIHDFAISRCGRNRSEQSAGVLVGGPLLPYWRISRSVDIDLRLQENGVMIDDEHVVIIPSRDFAEPNMTLVILTL